MIIEDIAIVIQLRKPNATAIWNLVHSFPKLQLPMSLEYKTVTTPAEEAAAESDNVAVT